MNTDLAHVHCFANSLAPELQRPMWAQLARWGYPCVLEWSRFHLSLTGNLQGPDTQKVQRLEQVAQAWFGALAPCPFDGLSLFTERSKGADFVCVERWEPDP